MKQDDNLGEPIGFATLMNPETEKIHVGMMHKKIVQEKGKPSKPLYEINSHPMAMFNWGVGESISEAVGVAIAEAQERGDVLLLDTRIFNAHMVELMEKNDQQDTDRKNETDVYP